MKFTPLVDDDGKVVRVKKAPMLYRLKIAVIHFIKRHLGIFELERLYVKQASEIGRNEAAALRSEIKSLRFMIEQERYARVALQRNEAEYAIRRR